MDYLDKFFTVTTDSLMFNEDMQVYNLKNEDK